MNKPALVLLTTFLFCPLLRAQKTPDPAKAALISGPVEQWVRAMLWLNG